MTEVILSSDDLTVLGGPSRVNVSVDIGPAGVRGSRTFVGSGKPSLVDIGQTPLIFDMYVNLLASDDEYLNFYQYQIVDGVPTWASLFNLRPSSTSSKATADFVGGEATFYIPVTSIVPPSLIETVGAENFNVQFNIKNGINPVSASLSVADPVLESEIYSLPITINAIEYKDLDDSGPLSEFGWVALDGEKEIDLFITLANTVISLLES
jgi:hypothetical protein